MRIGLTVLVFATCLADSGCAARLSAPSGFSHLATRNLTQEPIRWWDDCVCFKNKAKKHAEAAWAEVVCQNSGQSYSEDYGSGFLEGFVDYLDSGGNGEPPVAPAFRYRLSSYKNPEGIRAAEDWFAGFRHGATVARMTGLRNNVLVPLSAPILAPSNSPSDSPGDGRPALTPQIVPGSSNAEMTGKPQDTPAVGEEKLPHPRQLPPDVNSDTPSSSLLPIPPASRLHPLVGSNQGGNR